MSSVITSELEEEGENEETQSDLVPQRSSTEDDITIVLTEDTSSPHDTPPCKRYKLDDDDIIIVD